jgi:hypothetical protein
MFMTTLRLIGGLLLCALATTAVAQEPVWNAAAIKECDRACLVGVMDGYMNAIFKRDKTLVPPLALDVRMTENTGQMEVGEGVLWRSKTEPTTFNIYVADPVQGQVPRRASLCQAATPSRHPSEGGSRQDSRD